MLFRFNGLALNSIFDPSYGLDSAKFVLYTNLHAQDGLLREGEMGKRTLGKIDYNGSGRRNCRAELTWSLENGRFSMQAAVWNPRESDCYTCGQCVDEVVAYFPQDKQAQRMAAVWRRWHLNDMKAGSPAQEQWLRDNPIDRAEYAYPKSRYEVVSAKLAAVGLNPDQGYNYGSAWKLEELPPDILAEIRAW